MKASLLFIALFCTGSALAASPVVDNANIDASAQHYKGNLSVNQAAGDQQQQNNSRAIAIGHDADAPDKDDDHLHEATPALVPCIALERTTNETGTIHHHPTATELTLVRYQYPHDSDTWLYIGDGSRSHGLDITLESARRLVNVLEQYVAVAEEG